MYQIPPQSGGASGSGVQENLQTRCRKSLQPLQTGAQCPKLHRGRCARTQPQPGHCWPGAAAAGIISNVRGSS